MRGINVLRIKQNPNGVQFCGKSSYLWFKAFDELVIFPCTLENY